VTTKRGPNCTVFHDGFYSQHWISDRMLIKKFMGDVNATGETTFTESRLDTDPQRRILLSAIGVS